MLCLCCGCWCDVAAGVERRLIEGQRLCECWRVLPFLLVVHFSAWMGVWYMSLSLAYIDRSCRAVIGCFHGVLPSPHRSHARTRLACEAT